MADRVQVNDNQGREQIAPASGVVDTFSQTNAGDSLTRLAQSLSGIAPGLAQLGAQLGQESAQKDQVAGALDANTLAKNRQSYKDAVSSGVLKVNESPWYQYGMQKETGRLAADKYAGDLLTATLTDPSIANSTNNADFDKFEQAFRDKWAKDNLADVPQSEAFQQGFTPMANAHAQDQRMKFAEAAAERAKQTGFDLHTTRTINTVVSEIGRGVDPSIIAGELGQQTQAWILNGGDGTTMNKATVDGVIEAARFLGDPLLARELLLQISGGPKGSKLGLTQYGIDKLKSAEQEISMEKAQADSRAAQDQQRRTQQATESILSDAVNQLNQAGPDAHNVNLSGLVNQMQKVDPDKVRTLLELQTAFTNQNYTDDPKAKAGAFLSIYGLDPAKPGYVLTRSDAADLLAGRHITTATFNELISKMTEEEKNGHERSAQLANDPWLKMGKSRLKSMFLSEMSLEGPTMRWRAAAADGAFTNNYIAFRAANPTATPEQINKWIESARQSIFQNFSDTQTINEESKVPKSGAAYNPPGPQPVDPTKALVTDPSNIRLAQSEFDELGTRRHAFSTYVFQLLKNAGIDPNDKKSVAVFLRAQTALMHGVVPPIQQDTSSTP